MCLPDRCQNLPGSQQDICFVHIAGSNYLFQAHQVVPALVHPVTDKGLSFLQVQTDPCHSLIDNKQLLQQLIQRHTVIFFLHKKVVHARLRSLFMLQQPVGYIIIGRNHEDPVVIIASRRLAYHYILKHIFKFGHGSPTYLMNC